mmetsp:Transcript_75216/g.124963  ORF Transcript_75216/g.124963 Transcript_75216/m.124963 type:complete len:80 (+) Transcript_75216:17-256(+)
MTMLMAIRMKMIEGSFKYVAPKLPNTTFVTSLTEPPQELHHGAVGLQTWNCCVNSVVLQKERKKAQPVDQPRMLHRLLS